MNPQELGKKYDKIAAWWHSQHKDSEYGLTQVRRALMYCTQKKSALDVGCGSGGRIIKELVGEGLGVTGVDVSTHMLKIAQQQHPDVSFYQADICEWEAPQTYDLIVAWDSIFHLPFSEQARTIKKLCGLLNEGGILMYTFGNAYGEHESDWHNDKFYYSSIGINENLTVLLENNCQCLHLELDQYPENHVYVIAQKLKQV